MLTEIFPFLAKSKRVLRLSTLSNPNQSGFGGNEGLHTQGRQSEGPTSCRELVGLPRPNLKAEAATLLKVPALRNQPDRPWLRITGGAGNVSVLPGLAASERLRVPRDGPRHRLSAAAPHQRAAFRCRARRHSGSSYRFAKPPDRADQPKECSHHGCFAYLTSSRFRKA